MESNVSWRTFAAAPDKHPQDQEHGDDSSRLLWRGYVWCGEWEPFAAASKGIWYGHPDGGIQSPVVIWRRQCCPAEEEAEEDDDDESAAWLFCEGCGCPKETARMRSFSDHAYCNDCTSRD